MDPCIVNFDCFWSCIILKDIFCLHRATEARHTAMTVNVVIAQRDWAHSRYALNRPPDPGTKPLPRTEPSHVLSYELDQLICDDVYAGDNDEDVAHRSS